MTSEVKIFAICACGIAAVIGCISLNDILEKRQELKELEAKNALELEKAKLEGTYPPEYWTAKAAEAEANAKVRQASIESEERLKLDARDREKAEKEALREFEKNAPAEYWEQKRIEEEEKTKRELNKQRYESEKLVAESHNEALKESARIAARAAERTLKQGFDYSTGFGSI